jgi:hypothetical protein
MRRAVGAAGPLKRYLKFGVGFVDRKMWPLTKYFVFAAIGKNRTGSTASVEVLLLVVLVTFLTVVHPVFATIASDVITAEISVGD